jgi:sulfur carrier protein ThiS adenylyltransferase
MNVEKQEKIKKKLNKSSVGIAGAGGLGSNVAVSLARCGVGKIIVADFDKVEKSNLNRQFYFKDQIGKVKVDCLKENILRIDESIKVEIINKKLVFGSMHKSFLDCDVVVEALDDAETKTNFIEDITKNLVDTPIVSCSGVSGYGHIDRIKTKKLGNLYIIYDEDARDSNEDILTAPRVTLLANWQANLVLEILLGEDQ